MKWMRVVGGVLFVGVVVFVLVNRVGPPSRKCFLGEAMHNFDGSGGVPAVVASLYSSHDGDRSAWIDVTWRTPDGETGQASASTDRVPGDPKLELRYAVLRSEFPRGTEFTAEFRIRGDNDPHWRTNVTTTLGP